MPTNIIFVDNKESGKAKHLFVSGISKADFLEILIVLV